MSGGEIIIKPRSPRKFVPHECMILGNTVMYGATGGFLFANGLAGERFCVRNSGGTAVVEGVGDHGCEYMTNGTVVILGATGKNFGAGMTGGLAYVLDLQEEFAGLYNPQLITPSRIADATDAGVLQSLIQRHLTLTGSERAGLVLSEWDSYLPKFWKVSPTVPAAQPIPEPAKEADATGTVINENIIASPT